MLNFMMNCEKRTYFIKCCEYFKDFLKYFNLKSTFQLYLQVHLKLNKSAKWHCGRHTLICKKILIKKT